MSQPGGPSRRRFLAGAAGLVGGVATVAGRDLFPAPAAAAAPRPTIRPRSDWAKGLEPKGPLPVEAPGDVKFLLVHHTAGANGYAQDSVPATLRGIYSFHTGPEKGWNDVAYNFFVDAFGGIWEGRKGSIDAPVKGSATGGSQGFALLCCFMGDHQAAAPTRAAQDAMSDLLAWLAGVYRIDLNPGARVTFVSRGSNRHPAGKRVETPTIAAHRDMSSTTCPGDACYALVRGGLAQAAAAKLGTGGAAAPRATVAGPAPTTGAPAVTEPATPAPPGPTVPAASATPVEEDNPPPPVTAVSAPVEVAGRAPTPEDSPSRGRMLGISGVGALGAAVGAAVFLRRRRDRVNAESRWYSSEPLNPPGGDPLDPPWLSEQPPEVAAPEPPPVSRPHRYRPGD